MLLYSTFTSNHVLCSQLWYSVLKLNHYTTCCCHQILHWKTVKCPCKHVALFHRMTCCRVSFEPLCDLLPYPKFMPSRCVTCGRIPNSCRVAVWPVAVSQIHVESLCDLLPYPKFMSRQVAECLYHVESPYIITLPYLTFALNHCTLYRSE